MNREMRRQLARREFPKTQATQTRKLTLSEASRIEQRVADEELVKKAFKLGKVEGMDTMYSLVMQACDRIKGIGDKRKKQLKEEVCEIIMEIGRDGLINGT